MGDSMINDIEKLVKQENKENIILKIMLIIVCVITIIINYNDYSGVFSSKSLINDKTSMEKSIINTKNYVYVNLKDAKETRFTLENNKRIINIYEMEYDNKNMLVMLDKNTALTKKIEGILQNKKDSNLEAIKEKLKKENKDSFYDYYFTNVDYSKKEMIVKLKLYVTVGFIAVLLFGIIIDIIRILNPKKTFLFRKYHRIITKKKKDN